MLDHVSIGVRDLTATKTFYDAALTPLGYACKYAGDGGLGYGDKAGIAFWISTTKSPVKDDDGSGLHICFRAPDRKAVDAFHAAALKAGGRDNGKPGLRPEYSASYYGAFVKDPDGYRVEAHFEG
jgi:catechol 2,3-dioxygenase-like lactoylglutathione lyase family enzyme